MKSGWAVWVIVCAGLVAAVPSMGQMAPADNSADYGKLAQRIVDQCAGIKEGEIVNISGNVRDMPLLESLAIEVRKVGAFPLLSVATDAMGRRMITDVPERYDAQSPRLDLKLAEMVDAAINLDWGNDPAMNADIPSQRLEAINRAWIPVSDLYAKRCVRSINLGNGVYPSPYNAALYGMKEEDLREIFWDAVNVDYTRIQAIGKSVSEQFAKGKEVRVTNPNGTDIRFQVTGCPVTISDGVISAEDLDHGYSSAQHYLPAGEVFLAPVPGTAEGKVVIDRMWFQGKEVDGLTLTFKRGKLTEMTGKPGFEAVKARYDLAGEGKDDFAFVDVGVNPNMKIPEGSKLLNWTVPGMISIGIGGNVWAGGANTCPYGLSGYLPGSTLAIDGKPLVKEGTLKVAKI